MRLVIAPGGGSQESGVCDEPPATPDFGSLSPVSFSSRSHFFAAAAEAMRRILVEQARRKASLKHGGQMQRHDLDACEIDAPERSVDLLALDEALGRLQALDRRKADLVKLRYFVGLTIKEAAAALGISESTADADWAYAKSWLRLEING
jgi:RNA polymerase sigma factor (TIGR02999 family)